MTPPPLPKAERIEAVQFCDDAYWFSAEQMCEYGKQCVEADTALLRQALDVLENHTAIKHPQQIYYRDSAIAAIKERLG